MPITLKNLIIKLNPQKTVLFLGAGASVPSNGPVATQLISELAERFSVSPNNFNLSELASLIEQNNSRAELIEHVRRRIKPLKPTGGILNIPLYEWKSIFTTNYDSLVEQSYEKKSKKLSVYSSNFDFSPDMEINTAKLFKLHGTIEKDAIDGDRSRIIITESDYDLTDDYREKLYDRFKNDLNDSHVVIIGHSLIDPDIKAIVDRAVKINGYATNLKITLLVHEKDENRAQLIEKRGVAVCFSNIDSFFNELANSELATAPQLQQNDDLINDYPRLLPITIAVNESLSHNTNVSAIFNGWSASYADINGGLTFKRTVSTAAAGAFDDNVICVTIIGASGVGKTTAARQVLLYLKENEYLCYEHKPDYRLNKNDWLDLAKKAENKSKKTILFIDDAHNFLNDVNGLLDSLVVEKITKFKILLTTSRNQWAPRIKSPVVYKFGKELSLNKLDSNEINQLLSLVENNSSLRQLIGKSFDGFTRNERKRRLTDRCDNDMFVCLKNIFESNKFDDIILREYADLSEDLQNIYRYVATMESSGMRVHRQLVMRLLSIQSESISAALTNLTDIIQEYPINAKEGIYGWRGRHSVIVGIIKQYKFSNTDHLISLFDKVIDTISPSYEIEVRTLIELCSTDAGILGLPDLEIQNRFFRKIMSIIPGEKIPRHRLIKNLIDNGDFEKAEAEVSIFIKDFKKSDASITRYKINLFTARAAKSKGILLEDRIKILNDAHLIAKNGAARFANNRHVLGAYCDLGIEFKKITSEYTVFDQALIALRLAEEKTSDPEISKMIARYDRTFTNNTN